MRKKNLITALVLSLDYELENYSTKDYTYKVDSSSEFGSTVTITVKPSETGCYHGLQQIYAMIHNNLHSHARVEGGNLVITVF